MTSSLSSTFHSFAYGLVRRYSPAELYAAPLRLLSLVTVDLPPTVDTGVIRIAGAAHADEVLVAARADLPADVRADVVVGQGESIEDAVAALEWTPGEVAFVGSSRLAQPRNARAPASTSRANASWVTPHPRPHPAPRVAAVSSPVTPGAVAVPSQRCGVWRD